MKLFVVVSVKEEGRVGEDRARDRDAGQPCRGIAMCLCRLGRRRLCMPCIHNAGEEQGRS